MSGPLALLKGLLAGRPLLSRAVVAFLFLALFHVLGFRSFRRSTAPWVRGAYPVIGHLIYVLNNYERILDSTLKEFKETRRKTLQIFLPFCPAFILTIDPRNVEHILSKKFTNYEKGPDFHNNLSVLLGDGIFTSDGETWKVQRKTASQIFTTKNFRDMFTAVFLEEAAILTKRLERSAREGDVLDLHDYLHRLTLDSFGRLAFGVNLGCLENEKPQEFAAAFDGIQKVCDRRFLAPGWSVYERFLGISSTVDDWKKKIDEFAYRIIRERRENANSEDITKADLITRFMTITDENGNAPTDVELRDHVTNFIIAGRDTTAQALSWTFYRLQLNPRVLAKLVEEIDSAVSKLPPGQDINYEVVKSLTYAHCCISETLRLHPSVPKNQKTALEDDTLPDGTFVPKGASVAHIPWVMGRSKEIWGEDAEEYRPERWLNTVDNSDEVDVGSGGAYQAKVNQFKFPAFHAGPRLCLGQGMAYLEAVSVLAFVLSRLKIEVLNPETVTYANGLTLAIKDGLKVRVQIRKDVA